MIVDGKGIAERIYRAQEARRALMPQALTIGLLACGSDLVTESFIRIKSRAAVRLGISIERIDLPEDASTAEAIAAVAALAGRTDSLIVQLPLPNSIDTDAVLAAIPNAKDADALNPRISEDERLVHAPVALAAVEILDTHRIAIRGAHAAVVGAGRLVGVPSSALLRSRGASVSMITLEEGSLHDLNAADIVVSGAGSPGLITPQMLKRGCSLIDAGASEQGGAVRGDADPACAGIASVFTPVPGGVGPIAVAMLFRNILDLAEKACS